MKHKKRLASLVLVLALGGCSIFTSGLYSYIFHGTNQYVVFRQSITNYMESQEMVVGQQGVANGLAGQMTSSKAEAIVGTNAHSWVRGHAGDLHQALIMSEEPPKSCLWFETFVKFNFTSGFDGCR